MNKTYPYYQFRCELIATATKAKLTFQEAEDKVEDIFRKKQKPYSFIVKQNCSRENNLTEQQTRVPIENIVAPQNTLTDITGATALPETALPSLHEMVVKEPGIKAKQTTGNKNDKDAKIQLENEAKTTGVSTDYQSEHERVKDKTLQPDEKLETATFNETRICNQEATVEDTTVNSNKTHK